MLIALNPYIVPIHCGPNEAPTLHQDSAPSRVCLGLEGRGEVFRRLERYFKGSFKILKSYNTQFYMAATPTLMVQLYNARNMYG